MVFWVLRGNNKFATLDLSVILDGQFNIFILQFFIKFILKFYAIQ
jgi:hypothetical protein